MDVGVRELKQHLSEYLDRAERGELIRITERGKPKAILGPLPGRLRIEQGIQEGWIRPGNGEPPVFPRKRFKASATIQEIMDEDRGE